VYGLRHNQTGGERRIVVQVYEERNGRDGNKDVVILVPTGIMVKSRTEFEQKVRANPELVKDGKNYRCVPDGRIGKIIRVEKRQQIKFI
jgi:hypothetical protein